MRTWPFLTTSPLLRIGGALGPPALALLVASCSSGGKATPPPEEASTTFTSKATCADAGAEASLHVTFAPMYSAYIPPSDAGMHKFQVPAFVTGTTANVTWSADETMVGMQVDQEKPNEVLLTMLSAGNTYINAQTSDGTMCASVPLYISLGKESDWGIGNARYNNGVSVHLAGSANNGDGSPLEQDGGIACTNCHGMTATASAFTDVSHTPEQTGGFSDQDLLNIILHGEFPDGGEGFDPSVVSYAAWMGFHRWTDITPDEQPGIIVYLRSLKPEPQKGQINFNAYNNVDSGSALADDAGRGAAPDGAPDAGSDGPSDAGLAAVTDGSSDAGLDAGSDATDAGLDASTDVASDSGLDATVD